MSAVEAVIGKAGPCEVNAFTARADADDIRKVLADPRFIGATIGRAGRLKTPPKCEQAKPKPAPASRGKYAKYAGRYVAFDMDAVHAAEVAVAKENAARRADGRLPVSFLLDEQGLCWVSARASRKKFNVTGMSVGEVERTLKRL